MRTDVDRKMDLAATAAAIFFVYSARDRVKVKLRGLGREFSFLQKGLTMDKTLRGVFGWTLDSYPILEIH